MKFKNQVTQIGDCQNVIHFYGLNKDSEGVYYLITEWAQNGNLREYIVTLVR